MVIGLGFTAVGLNRHAPTASRASADTPLVAAEPTGEPGTELLDDVALPDDPGTSAAGTPTSKPPTPKATTSSPKPKPTKRKTSAPRTAEKAGAAPATSGSILDQVLAHINSARAGEGLPPYRLDSSLSKAAALHNQLMIDGCELSHQCPGEGGIGDRFSAQGVNWSSAGENIGFGSAGSSNSAIVRAANGLTDSMLAEVPPEDGHRKNLLSKGFKRIGLSVVRDGKGIVWMTQDFVG
ncbi:CAP domain-containing protein [Actinoplanes sp. NPDC049118]|uniref:CAP domain-containing protein n=1 Tax=Actinoplanes sp. NPDC049118 TaxID=3155769 RepID=UPI0033D180C1